MQNPEHTSYNHQLTSDAKTLFDSPYLLEYAPLAEAPDDLPCSLLFPVIIFKLPKLPFDLLMGNFSFTSDGLPSASMFPGVLPYKQFCKHCLINWNGKDISTDKQHNIASSTHRCLSNAIWRRHSKRAKWIRSLIVEHVINGVKNKVTTS